jgi:hypothetical protein
VKWNEDHPCWYDNHEWEYEGDSGNWVWKGDKDKFTFFATCSVCGLTVTTKPVSVEVTE